MLTTQLITDFNAKQEYAWKHFYDLFQQHLVFYVQRLIRDRQEAEDIVNKCFEKILYNESLVFESPAKLKSFLFVSARNEAFDLRDKRKRDESELIDQLTLEEMDIPAEPWPEEGKVKVLMAVRECIECLPPAIKEVMVLRFFEGMKAIEIAKQKGLSVQTINNQVSAGLKKVKEMIGRAPLN